MTTAAATDTNTGFAKVRNEDSGVSTDDISYASLVSEVRTTFNSGKTKSLAWRRQQLLQIKKMFIENHRTFAAAVRKDHGGPVLRGVGDMVNSFKAVHQYLDNLEKYSAPIQVEHPEMFGKSYVRKEPKGVILLIAPWNFPVAMVTDALIGIIAAGNCCVIKPSEVSVHSCQALAEIIPKYLDPEAVRLVTGGVPETTALLREKYDHIVYTGNGAIARIIMKAAAQHLTPVTLELGGKSPTYIDKSAKLNLAVDKIVQYKWANAGQICIVPDYILVHENVAEEFKAKVVEATKVIYGETTEKRKKNKRWGNIINGRHVERIKRLLEGSTGNILLGGDSDPNAKFFDATIIENPKQTDLVMKEEIFGPILPIVTVKGPEEAVERINKTCNQPLALYIFSENQKSIDYILDHTTSGGVAINAALEQQANESLPFGGIGESGLGKYHGIWGFDEFSHFRSVFVKNTTFSGGSRAPPSEGRNDEYIYNLVIKRYLTGFLTDTQKSLLKATALAAVAAGGYLFTKFRV